MRLPQMTFSLDPQMGSQQWPPYGPFQPQMNDTSDVVLRQQLQLVESLFSLAFLTILASASACDVACASFASACGCCSSEVAYLASLSLSLNSISSQLILRPSPVWLSIQFLYASMRMCCSLLIFRSSFSSCIEMIS